MDCWCIQDALTFRNVDESGHNNDDKGCQFAGGRHHLEVWPPFDLQTIEVGKNTLKTTNKEMSELRITQTKTFWNDWWLLQPMTKQKNTKLTEA